MSATHMGIVHEWLSACGGAEQVVSRFAHQFPAADLLTLSVDPAQRFIDGDRNMYTSFLDRDRWRDRRQVTLPLMPWAWRRLCRNRRYDTVLVSHHALATASLRHLRTDRSLAYVHTPARYLWSPHLDSRSVPAWAAPVRHLLTGFDRRSARLIDDIAVNSRAVAARVNDHWDRDARVIHPPVDVEFFRPDPETDRNNDVFVLGASRFVQYKRLDRVIEAGEAVGCPVVLAGSGPLETELRRQAASASVPVTFVISPSRDELRQLYQRCGVFVFPAVEDFGIMPVEAQACGTPVVAVAEGGSLDSVDDGRSGCLVSDWSPATLRQAISDALNLSADDCRRQAERFAVDIFDRQIRQWVGGEELLPPSQELPAATGTGSYARHR